MLLKKTKATSSFVFALVIVLATGCNSITANYYDPAQEATLYAGPQRILCPRKGQMETVDSLPDAIDLPFTLIVDTLVIPINLVYIFTGYEPNLKDAPEPEGSNP